MPLFRRRAYRGPIFKKRLPQSMQRRPTAARSFNKSRLIIGLIMAAFALISFFGSREYNPYVNEYQYIGIATHQEIALGLQAVPELMEQYGGLYPSQADQDRLGQIGYRIVSNSKAGEADWNFTFYLLNDPETVNAFALPGGPVFITRALYERLTTDGQLAGVLGHEIGHVVARHGSQKLAEARLTQGLTGAVIAASGSQEMGQLALIVGQMVNMKYGRDDELQSDKLGVVYMSEAGYDPRSMIKVMQVLAEASEGRAPPEFFSTHPNPDNRIERIIASIQELYPDGVPEILIP